jgi:hypothetical protein
MSSANKVIANAAIPQRGTYGYLLWLRRDMPNAYAAAARAIPALAQFEASLPKSRGLGDDFSFDVPDVSFDVTPSLPPADSFTLDPSTVDLVNVGAPDFISSSLIPVDVPAMPAIDAPSDVAPSVASSAASAVTSALPAIAKIVVAALPVAAAVINRGTSTQNAQTIAKANQTAQLQYAAAIAGGAPLQTGLVSTPTGLQYLAPIAPLGGSLSSALSASVMGIPIWIVGLGVVGIVALASAKD